MTCFVGNIQGQVFSVPFTAKSPGVFQLDEQASEVAFCVIVFCEVTRYDLLANSKQQTANSTLRRERGWNLERKSDSFALRQD